MYPLTRLISTLVRASRAPKSSLKDVCETQFITRPWDLDLFMEMNNGRVLTLYDLGRFEVAIRSGLASQLKKQGWSMVVAGSSIRYRRRVRLFDKVTIRTQIVALHDRWVYLLQSMWVKGEPTSSVLLRTGVTKNGKTIPVDEVLEALGFDSEQAETPTGWVHEWIESEKHRPWPPEH